MTTVYDKTKLNAFEIKLADLILNNLDKPDFFVCSVPKVSASGMSRQIKVGMYYQGRLINISALVAKVTGWKTTKQGDMAVKVSGCGMDMIFHTLDVFVSRLFGTNGPKHQAVQHYTYF